MPLHKIEEQLNELLVRKAPFQLPTQVKSFIVQFAPWLALLGGALSMLAAWSLFNLATFAQNLANSATAFYAAAGYGAPVPGMGVMVWVGMAVLVVEGVLYFAAFPALQARQKKGWDLLFTAALVSGVYTLLTLFIYANYNPIGSFIGYLIGTVIGMYVLFQVRDAYNLGELPKADTPHAASPGTTKTNTSTSGTADTPSSDGDSSTSSSDSGSSGDGGSSN